MSRTKGLVVAITGGSGAGKTMIIDELIGRVGSAGITRLEQDAYYKDQAHLSLEERYQVNYDHPDALDLELMKRQVMQLRDGQPVDAPIFEYTQCARLTERRRVDAKPILLVEGILILHDPEFRSLLDLSIFVESDADTRLARRLRRDVERGMPFEVVLAQYQRHVHPMYHEFIEPYRQYADLVILNTRSCERAIGTLACCFREVLRCSAVNTTEVSP